MKITDQNNAGFIAATNSMETGKLFWGKHFEGNLPLLEFSTDKVRQIKTSFKPAAVLKTFDQGVSENFKLLLKLRNIPIFTGLLALNYSLFHKYTNQEDIIFGIHLSGRELTQGLMHKTNALRILFPGSGNFVELAAEISRLLLSADPHLKYPFENLLADLGIKENNDRHPLFDVLVQMEETGSMLSAKEKIAFKAPVDMHFIFSEGDKGLDLKIAYNSEFFEEATIVRLCNNIEALLLAISLNPFEKINNLDFLPETEKDCILKEFNSELKAGNHVHNIIGLFEAQVERTPDNIALVFENSTLTYGELNERANSLSNYLKSKGIKVEALVPVCIERSFEMITAILGVLKSGGAYVPIDPHYPADRIKFILGECKSEIVISSNKSRSKIPPEDLEIIEMDSDWELINKFSAQNSGDTSGLTNLAYVIYTSGSTGKPKGVLVEHQHLLASTTARNNYYGTSGSIFLIPSFAFDSSVAVIFWALTSGGRLIMAEDGAIKQPGKIRELLKRSDTILCVPSYYKFLLDEGLLSETILSKIIVAGEELNEGIVKGHFEKTRGLILYNEYGPTENTVWSTVSRIASSKLKVTIGKPVANTKVYIVDNAGHLCPIGLRGEIWVGGGQVARGYLNRPDLTTEKFIKDPFNLQTNSRIYRTGDTGRWLPNGEIEFLERLDDQVKIRGYRIEPGEIENVIRQYPSVATVKVIDRVLPNLEKCLVAYMVGPVSLDTNELRKFLQVKLPTFMIPDYFVKMEDLPLTFNGKLDKKMLPEPEMSLPGIIGVDTLPLSPEEKGIAGIWSDLLGIHNISRTDNFFEIGGNSLIAIRFVIRLEKEMKVKLSMASLFEYPTVEKMATIINAVDKDSKWKSLVPIKIAGNKPPLYLVHGGGLGVLVFNNVVTHLDNEQPVYGLQGLGIDGKYEPLGTIEEMATFYISELLEQNAHGPYQLAGLSAGGLIAFEMARQLQESGKVIKAVVILDFDLIHTEKHKSYAEKINNILPDLFPILLFNIRSLIKHPAKTMIYYFTQWKLRYISLAKRLGFEKQVELTDGHLHLQIAVNKKAEAIKKYKITPYNGVIDILVSGEKVFFQKDPKFQGWKPYALKGINSHEVPGDHDTMMTDENTVFFAKALQDILNRN